MNPQQPNSSSPETPLPPTRESGGLVIQPNDEQGIKNDMANPTSPQQEVPPFKEPLQTTPIQPPTKPLEENPLGDYEVVKPSKKWRNYQLIMFPVAILVVGLPVFATYGLIVQYPQPLAAFAGQIFVSTIALALEAPQLAQALGALQTAGLIALAINVISYFFFLKRHPRKKSYVIGGSILAGLSVTLLALHFLSGVFLVNRYTNPDAGPPPTFIQRDASPFEVEFTSAEDAIRLINECAISSILESVYSTGAYDLRTTSIYRMSNPEVSFITIRGEDFNTVADAAEAKSSECEDGINVLPRMIEAAERSANQ